MTCKGSNSAKQLVPVAPCVELAAEPNQRKLILMTVLTLSLIPQVLFVVVLQYRWLS